MKSYLPAAVFGTALTAAAIGFGAAAAHATPQSALSSSHVAAVVAADAEQGFSSSAPPD